MNIYIYLLCLVLFFISIWLSWNKKGALSEFFFYENIFQTPFIYLQNDSMLKDIHDDTC